MDLTQLTLAELPNLALRTCPDCHGTARLDDQDCYCVEHFEQRQAEAEFPDRFRARTLADLDWAQIAPDQSRLALQRFARDLPTHLDLGLGLGLIGPVGCGKTHGLVGLGQLAIALGYAVWFVNVPELFHWLRQSYDKTRPHTYSTWELDYNRQARKEQESLLLEDLIKVEVLILDDLGAERPTEWARERLYLVVNQRWQQQRTTWLSSNESLDQLADLIGPRTLSRLTGDALILTLDGADYRVIEKRRRVQTALNKSRAA